MISRSNPSSVLLDLIILHESSSWEKIEKFVSTYSSLKNKLDSEEISRTDAKNELSDIFQSKYDAYCDSLDLSSIPDPSDPTQTSSYRVFATYTRRVCFPDLDNITITLTIRRIRPCKGPGATHSILPWYLSGWVRINLSSLLDMLTRIYDYGRSRRSMAAISFQRSYAFVYRLVKAYEFFNGLLSDQTVNDLIDLITLSLTMLKRGWLQMRITSGGRRVFAGLIPEN